MNPKDRLKAVPPLYWLARWLRMSAGELAPPKRLAGVPGRVHANDVMIPKRTAEHAPGYASTGKSVAALIDEYLPQELRGRPGRGLDLGCGHGRVLRHLVADFPTIRWTAADIDKSAVRFCRREFDVEGVVSSRRLADVVLPSAPYDIVWMGSLITHLDEPDERELWALLRRITEPGALLVLSTMGPTCVARLDTMMPKGREQEQQLESALAAHGHAYVSYPHYRGVAYGLAYHTAEHIDRAVREEVSPSAQRLAYRVDAWCGVQDVHVFTL